MRSSRVLALLLFVFGAAASAALNLRRWQGDRDLARRRRECSSLPPLPADGPLVSFLVAAWNEKDSLERHIRSVLDLTYPHFQYILAAGGKDGTYELAKRFEAPNVLVIEQQPGEGKQAALRRCLALAQGDVLFLTDADCLLSDASFAAAMGPIVRGEAQVVTGDCMPLPEQRHAVGLAAFRWAADAYRFANIGADVGGILGGNCALTRDAVHRAGDFAADVRSGTDYHLARALVRAGIPIRHTGESIVATRYPDGLRDYARRQRRWLRNLVLHGVAFGAKSDAAASLRTSFVGLGMLLAPIASLIAGPWLLALWAAAVFHSAASKLRYLAFTAEQFKADAPAVTAGAAVQSVGLSLAEFGIWAWPLLDYLVPSRRTSW